MPSLDLDETVFVVSRNDLGVKLTAGKSDDQAGILLAMARDIESWGETGNWPMQCRDIAEYLSDNECHSVVAMLGELLDHLRAVPAERKQTAAPAAEEK